MKTVTKQVYYCEFCKRHRLTANSILGHEPRCLYNPARSVCGWHPALTPRPPADLVPAFTADPDLGRLRVETDGCPACMLAVVVQARSLGGLDASDAYAFDYKTEVETFRKEEQRADAF